MSNTTYFTPGPTGLYPKTPTYLQDALAEDIMSISHRSAAFKKVYQRTAEALSSLLSLPSDQTVIFTPSATEVWERLLRNCVEKRSFHFTNGSFSKKFAEYSRGLGLDAAELKAEFGFGFNIQDAAIRTDDELLAITHNETSSGVSFPEKDIHSLAESHTDKIIALDMVSSTPHPSIDFSKVDTALFSVQKCFGLPSGQGVWIANEKCIEKANELTAKGHNPGPHHSLKELATKAKAYQNPCTPNILGIYLLGRVAEDLLARGIGNVRRETKQKATLLYNFLEKTDGFAPLVNNQEHRSETVVVATSERSPVDINKALLPFEMQIGAGYGAYKESQIRIANFPGTSVEQMESLISKLQNL